MRRLYITVAAVMAAAATSATIMGSGIPAGDAGKEYLRQAISMYDAGNYAGCIDLTGHISQLSPDAVVMEQARYYKALSSLYTSDDEALRLLREWLADYPVSPLRGDALAAAGDYYFMRSAWADALEWYSKINPDSPDVRLADAITFRRSYCLMLLGERAAALEGFATLTGSPEFGRDARFYQAYIAYLDKDFDKALKGFEASVSDEAPGNAAPYYMAQIYFVKGEFTKALELARQLASSGTVGEFIPECNRIAGESLYNLGREDEAIPYLWKYCAETKSPEPGAFYILGVSEYRAGHIDEAIKLLQKAIGNHSAMEQSAYLFLGQAYVARGDNSSALMAFENAYRVDYDREVGETAFYNYAVARMEGGRVPFGNSVALLDDFLNKYPDSRYAADVQRYIVNGYMTDNDYASALAAISKIKAPTEAILRAKQRVLFVMATRDFQAKDYVTAFRRFNEAVEIKHGDPAITRQALLWTAECYYRLGGYEDAVSTFEKYLSATPATAADAYNRKLAMFGAGYAFFAEENYKAARSQFEKAIAAPGDLGTVALADAYNRLADCDYYLKDITAAEKNYAKALELYPEAGDYAMYQLAVMKGLLKNHSGKVALLDRLAEQYPTSGLLPSALLGKAESLMAMGKSSDAIATYRLLVEKYPLTSQGRNGYLQLAITYMSMGKQSDAIEAYRKVIATYPSSEEARVASEDLKQIYAADGKLKEFADFIASIPDAPSFDPSEIEQLSYSAAENDFFNKGMTEKLEKFLEDYPRSTRRAQALYYLAEAAWNEGDSETALAFASRVVESHPDAEVVEDAMLIKGKAEADLGKLAPALATFRALELKASGSNKLREARMGIMTTAMALGQYSDVVTTADKLLTSTAASESDDTEIRFMRAFALNGLHDYDRAYAEWGELAANMVDINGVKSAYYMGQSQLDRGLISDALATADTLISSDTPHRYWLARGFILYSDALRAQGNAFEADEYLKSLKANYPGTEADIFQMINNRLKK